MSTENERLPDWIAYVPMPENPGITWIQVIPGKLVRSDLLREALTIEQGTMLSTFSVASAALRQRMVEFSEQPGWRNLPAEPTSIARTGENSWEAKVGTEIIPLTLAQITALLEPTPPASPDTPAD